MQGLEPERWQKQPSKQGKLAVDSLHSLYWRCYGNANLQAVLFLHGGPGSGADVSHLCFFNPDSHFVVMFDQRGAGQSTPSGCIENNTTQHLIADIESLRLALGVDRWIIFGGSWGATLGLLYAQYHPSSCVGLVLRGISNSHVVQNRWVLEERPKLMPDRYQAFIRNLSEQDRTDPVRAFYHYILGKNADCQLQALNGQLQALNAINVLESGMSEAEPKPLSECEEFTSLDSHSDKFHRAKIYLHYWAHEKFLGRSQCLPNPSALDRIPVNFIHGESDWICPLSGAVAIVSSVHDAQLVTVPAAGHSPFHPEMQRALRKALTAVLD